MYVKHIFDWLFISDFKRYMTLSFPIIALVGHRQYSLTYWMGQPRSGWAGHIILHTLTHPYTHMFFYGCSPTKCPWEISCCLGVTAFACCLAHCYVVLGCHVVCWSRKDGCLQMAWQMELPPSMSFTQHLKSESFSLHWACICLDVVRQSSSQVVDILEEYCWILLNISSLTESDFW